MPPGSDSLPTIAADWLLLPETQSVFRMLRAGGHEGRAVGGSVRNELMGLPVADIDIATTAKPDDVIRLAAAAGLVTVPTGLKHGTVTVVVDHHPFEVTTLREDVETFGRHATVAFTADWTTDARRRDFTINALYCDATGQVFDPIGGYPDILTRRVRFIGDAVARIREDYLRILRFFRFSAQYGHGDPDRESLLACVRERRGMAGLSAERIHAEFMKLLIAPRATALTRVMFDFGILVDVLRAAPRLAMLERLVAIEAAQSIGPTAALRFAALAVAVEDDAIRLDRQFRLSGSERETLTASAPERLGGFVGLDDAAARRALYRQGADRFRSRLTLAWAAVGATANDPHLSALVALSRTWTPPKFPLGGQDVIARGIEPGPELGVILREVEDWWITAGFPSRERALEQKLDECVAASIGRAG